MKLRFIIVVALIAAVIIGMNTSAIKGFFLAPKQEITARIGTLDYYVQKAKADGKSEISFVASLPEGPEYVPWPDAISRSRSSIVRAQVIYSRTYPTGFDPDGEGPITELIQDNMVTWYKLRIIETLQNQG
jgi:hypothetical protein